MTHENQFNTELDWLAFRYIAGEMPDAESTAFESRLAEDQSAREAVSRAVELTETVSACHFDLEEEALDLEVQLPSRARRSHWWSAAVWASLGAAASLLLVLVLQGMRENDTKLAKSFPGHSDLPLDSAGELAEVWSETREPLVIDGQFSDTSLLETGDDSAAGQFADDLLPSIGDENRDGDLTAPEWMLAALEDLASDEAEHSEEVQTP